MALRICGNVMVKEKRLTAINQVDLDRGQFDVGKFRVTFNNGFALRCHQCCRDIES